MSSPPWPFAPIKNATQLRDGIILTVMLLWNCGTDHITEQTRIVRGESSGRLEIKSVACLL